MRATVRGEVVHPLRADRRTDDRVRLSGLPFHPVCAAADIPCNRRSGRMEQRLRAAQHHCARARYRRLSSLGAFRADPAGQCLAGGLGSGIRLAARRPPALPAARDTDRARYAELRHRGGGDRGAAPGLHAIPGAHLARSRAAHRDELTGPTMIALARDERKKSPGISAGVLSYASTTESLTK